MIKITFPDNSVREYAKGTTAMQIAESISSRLAQEVLAASVNGEVWDLSRPINDDATVKLLKWEDEEGKHAFWHSSAHLMAEALQELYPGIKFGIGPAIENGFYYDVDPGEATIKEGDFPAIEAKMLELVAKKEEIKRQDISKADALKMFGDRGEEYKTELISELEDGKITTYTQGAFTDLCRGPHLPNTSYLKAVKIMSVAGAYWRGDEKNKMLQRIYGTAFPSKEELDAYLHMLEEAARRDHRKLGKELDLFSIMEEGPGFPFFHPNGMVIRNELINYWREVHRRYGYQEIKTPMILSRKLWETSGHWDHYRENMYVTEIDNEDYAIKPMNCPGGMLVYKTHPHSYRELPIRAGELGLVHRHELSGALHGLFRVRCFTQDDAHIFMMPSQIKDEIQNVIRLFDEVYATFGLKYHAELSTRPEDSMGDAETWETTTNALKSAMEDFGLDYVINEGDGAFYGPKIDFHLTDSIGRTWQCGTIQLDMLLPEKFDLTYTGEDGLKHRPVMIHRVVYGSIERFIGILIENYAGAFPAWLAPCQVRVMPITDKHYEYAKKLSDEMFKLGLRVYLDDRNEKIGYKIREAQLQKVPYMLVIGDKEVEDGTVAVRRRGEGDIGAMKQEDFIAMLQEEIADKK